MFIPRLVASISLRSALLQFAVAAVAVSAVACSSSPTAPSSASAGTVVLAAGDQSQAKTPSAPAPFSGTWYQDPVQVVPQGNGGTGHVYTRLTLTQKGSTITGEARRFISTWDAAGAPVWVDFDLGSPGKVTGTATATSMSIVIRDYTETKQTLSLGLALSADGTRLSATAGVPNAFGISGFRR